MSDGGAGALVKVGELLSRSLLGQIILSFGALFLGANAVAEYLSGGRGAGLTLFFAAILALFAGVGLFRTWLRNRAAQARRRSLKWAALLVGAVGLAVALVFAGIVVLVRRRGHKSNEVFEAPDPQQIDALAREELS